MLTNQQKKQLSNLVKLTVLEAIADDVLLPSTDEAVEPAEWNEAIDYVIAQLQLAKQ